MPTWYERQTFYTSTGSATLINFGAKVIVNCVRIYVSGVSESKCSYGILKLFNVLIKIL